MRIQYPAQESGAIPATPALQHNTTTTEHQRPNPQARRASQPNLTTYMKKAQAIPSNGSQQTPPLTTTTTNTSVAKSPQTTPRRPPEYDTVQHTHRDQYTPLTVIDKKTGRKGIHTISCQMEHKTPRQHIMGGLRCPCNHQLRTQPQMG